MIQSIIFGFILLSFISIFRPVAKVEKYIVIFCGLVMLLFAGFREDSFDYIIYELLFENYETISVEPAFKTISYLVTQFTEDIRYLFLIFAFLGVSLKLKGITTLSNFVLLSLVVYVSNFYLLHEMTQIRAGVASAFLLLSIKPNMERDLKKFLLFAILGFLFHYSALLILPLWFLPKKINVKILGISIFLGYASFFLGLNFVRIIPIPGIQEKIEAYLTLQEMNNEEINVFGYLYLFRILIFYVLLFNYKKFSKYNIYFPLLLNMYAISLVVFTVFGKIPAFSSRISEMLGVVEIILIPMLVYLFRVQILGRLLVVLVALVFLLVNLFYVELIFDI
ncbi:EpsG family protein [Kaistella polysaccharea]|uniref:EpsG family protein n=1 Tax=Kaistella polysaccharea TaxID=2878534 RepID=UPI001CF2F2B9|nr:EpsG family protein [Kaistella polysaccharea]